MTFIRLSEGQNTRYTHKETSKLILTSVISIQLLQCCKMSTKDNNKIHLAYFQMRYFIRMRCEIERETTENMLIRSIIRTKCTFCIRIINSSNGNEKHHTMIRYRNLMKLIYSSACCWQVVKMIEYSNVIDLVLW